MTEAELQEDNARLRSEVERLSSLISSMGPTRSVNQNRYWWGVVVPYAIKVYRYCWGQRMTKELCHEKGNRHHGHPTAGR